LAQNINVNTIEKGDGYTGANAPSPADPSGAFLGLVSELTAGEKPVPARAASALTYIRPGEYRFRTRPGYRNTAIKLRIYERDGDDIVQGKNKERFKKWAKRQGLDLVKDLKVDEEIYDLLGDPYIQFRPVRGQMEATYTTKNQTVAAYIRGRIAAGEFRDVIYEDVRPIEVEIDGVKQLFVPANDQAREAVAFAQAAGD
jgi:hypothetical protein